MYHHTMGSTFFTARTAVISAAILLMPSCKKDDDRRRSGGGGGSTSFPSYLNAALTYGTVTDQDGNNYYTIQIGDQVWMAQNLRTTRYRNGDPIPNVTDGSDWGQLVSGAYSNAPAASVNVYGRLYNWFAVNDARCVCPTGWHVPTESDWSALINYLDPANGINGYYSETAGGTMKSTGTQYWFEPNTDATNVSGFSGLPGGGRGYPNGSFDDLGFYGGWWSASESGAEYAWGRYLGDNAAGVYRSEDNKGSGFSVRCLRD
jgi:uncharacterized protein (TIGR02145 family)